MKKNSFFIICFLISFQSFSQRSYQLPPRKAWQGRCLVIIKSGKKSGDIILKASSAGLKSAEITINAK